MSVVRTAGPAADSDVAQLAINTIRTLSIDAVQQAKSGHPGTPMALAPLVYTLWNRVMRFDPADPIWPNRDRFILSNGHASMLLWSVLHLTRTCAVNAEYEKLGRSSVSLDDIRNFRQLDSHAPGHPEYHWVSGVEATTGPLGQGVATSVGMAIARKWLAGRFNRPGFEMFDYNIYAVCGDGCLMEGISSEAASLAGHLGLDNLCWIFDNNHITIEGSTDITFTEDVAGRFLSYGWNVLRIGDANDIGRIEQAIEIFKKTTGRPTFIVLDSHIGYGSPNKEGKAEAHGEPLGDEECRLTKRAYGWPEDAQFLVPDGVYDHFAAGVGARGASLRSEWEARFAAYRQQFPDLANEIELMQRRELPAGWDKNLPAFPADKKGLAGRDASGQVLNVLLDIVQRRATRRAQMALVEAHADHAATLGDYPCGLVGDLPVARHDRAGVAVGGHDRAGPHREGVGHRLLSHVAQVENHLLATHRLQQLPTELGEPARRASAAAVARPAPGRPDDANAPFCPGAQLRRVLDGVGALHQQDGGQAAPLPAPHVRLELGLVADQLQAAGAVVVELGGGHEVRLVRVLVDEARAHGAAAPGRRRVEGCEYQADAVGYECRTAHQVARRGRPKEAPTGGDRVPGDVEVGVDDHRRENT